MMIRLIVVSIAISFAFTGFGQVPPIVWQSTFGNTGNEVLHSIAATADGNFMVMGIADVNGDEVDCDLKGQHDVWIFKMTPTGSIIWQKCFGGSKEEANPYNKIIATSDGGSMFISESWSKDFDATGHHKYSDVLTIKLDANGNVEWKKSFGGKFYDVPRNLLELPGKRYVIVSRSTSSDGDVPPNMDPVKFDAWVFIVNQMGAIICNNVYGGTGDDDLYKVLQDNEGNLVLFGQTNSIDGDLEGQIVEGTDAWLLKIDTTGNVLSSKVYGQSNNEAWRDALPAPNGGYFAFGITEDPGVLVDKGSYHGDDDLWAVKLDGNYNMQWQGVYGGSERETMMQAVAAPGNSGFYLAGGTYSVDGDVVKPSSNGNDEYVVKISPNGTLLWSFTHGGTEKDYANAITATGLVAGVAYSTDGDVIGGAGNGDGWIYKFKDKKTTLNQKQYEYPEGYNGKVVLQILPNPARDLVAIDFGGINGIFEIVLLDVTGKIKMQKTIILSGSKRHESIDVSAFDDGFYILQVTGEKLFQSVQMLISR